MLDRIIYQNPEFMVVDKPAGVLSQKDKSGDADLAELMKKAFKKKPDFLAAVHRLDRNTSGLIILAKSSKAAALLTDWIKDGEIRRSYFAIVKGDPGKEGRYEDSLLKNSATNQVFIDSAGDEAITQFKQLQKLGNSSVMKIELLTGKSHQIRAHFAHHGHALLGDKKYAKKPWSEIFGRPALHSWKLSFPETSQYADLEIEAPIPEDIQGLLKKLGGKGKF